MTIALWWARRDLRLGDNQALSAALQHAERVVPVFILDPALLDSPLAGDKRVAFMLGGLRQLADRLQERGSRLILRRGNPVDELTALVQETGAKAVFAEEDPWPYARERDAAAAASVPLHLTGGLTVHPPQAVSKADGLHYTVFTPFSRAWKSLPLPQKRHTLPPPERLASPPEIVSLPIPLKPASPPGVPFPAGEAEAMRRLQGFCTGEDPAIFRYADDRNHLSLEGTSRLSPYLRWGMASARQAVVGALEAMEAAPDGPSRRGAETWLNELIWREFYLSVQYHFPHVETRSFRPDLQNIAWEDSTTDFGAWCEGRTGYPVVDAAMRQLVQTGWMHNRARMIVASFLVKDLLIDWRWGERFFMKHLVDGDPAANNGGWQWTAGTGTDAAPYFRIFNPVLQGKKHDPEGGYVRQWVPELARIPNPYLHTPWEMPAAAQRDTGCSIGQDYPEPIIDHQWARERVLSVYTRARDQGG